jgi:hypothetical protein
MKRQGRLAGLALFLVGALALAGCAGMQTVETKSTEQLLSAAGFRMRLPDSPQKTAHLQQLPQRQLVAYTRNGKTFFVYADAANNHLYWGSQAAYKRYQQMLVEQKIASQRAMAAELNEAAAMDWEIWGTGPWDPSW